MGQISGCMIVGCGKDVTVAGGSNITITSNTLSTIHVTSGTATATNQVATTIDLNGGTTVIESVSADDINLVGGTGDFRLGVVADVNVGAAGTFTTTVGANVTGVVTVDGEGAIFTQTTDKDVTVNGTIDLISGSWLQYSNLYSFGTFKFKEGISFTNYSTSNNWLKISGEIQIIKTYRGGALNLEIIGDSIYNVISSSYFYMRYLKISNNSKLYKTGDLYYYRCGFKRLYVEMGCTFYADGGCFSTYVDEGSPLIENLGTITYSSTLGSIVYYLYSTLSNTTHEIIFGNCELNFTTAAGHSLNPNRIIKLKSGYTHNVNNITLRSNNGKTLILDLNGQTLNVSDKTTISDYLESPVQIIDSVGSGTLRTKQFEMLNPLFSVGDISNREWKLQLFDSGNINIIDSVKPVFHHLEQEAGATTTLLSDVYCNIKEIKGTIIDGGA